MFPPTSDILLPSPPESLTLIKVNIVEQINYIKHRPAGAIEPNPFEILGEELFSALSLYWSTAFRILRGSGINLLDPIPEYFSLQNNFFSVLFLYTYHKADIPKQNRILYGAVNQCLRGMVTGCDNILDNEYKKTLETDLPLGGTRFRSVLLFEILSNHCQTNGVTSEQVLAASAASLRALTRSGAQEATEEVGVVKRLRPEEVLRDVHHCKTGVLFQSPWAVPVVIEEVDEKSVSSLKEALYRIGMGCQIMDDMVDVPKDFQQGRHNYVISLIYHDQDPEEWSRLETRLTSDLGQEENGELLFEFSRARLTAVKAALSFLELGTKALFGERHQYLVEPTILFLSKRIGADRFISDLGR